MTIVNEGKTKIVRQLVADYNMAVVDTKDDITAGDGEKHDKIKGKAELSTRTTCNIFDYLAAHNVRQAYVGRDGPTSFLTWLCKMIPVELVVRNEAAGSYCKRHPDVPEGKVFDRPVVEFYLKTKDRIFGGQSLPCDDPLMEYDEADGCWHLFNPKEPDRTLARIGIVESFTKEYAKELFTQLQKCEDIALDVRRLLSDAWKKQGGRLIDMKLEFGSINGVPFLADVIDCDSWRVRWNGLQLSKQGYRDGEDIDQVLAVYRIAAAVTDRFLCRS